MTHEMTDAELVEQVQAGQSAAMSQLYRRYKTAVFRYTLSKVYDPNLAQDITGEIFLRMVAHLPQYKVTDVPFTVWLFRIARNYIITHLQKENRYQLMPISQTDNLSRAEDNPAHIVEAQLELEWIWRGLQQLDEQQRDVIVLRFIIGLSLKEVASTLERTVGAIKTLQHRGITALRVALQVAR
ncbi:MAG: RNA polymerase subunit sigma-24 [Chloroflexi bacterium]|nr:MAG: RNA polymerase subunit sigma-24 [Chloroflexota bacterium]